MNAYAEMPNFGNFYPTPNTEEDIVCDTNEGRRAFYAPDAITVLFSFQQNPLLLPIFMFYSFNSDSGAVKESDNSFFYPDFTAQFHVLDTRNIGKSYVGDCNLSFYGYNKNLPLYANQGDDPSSFNISASIRAKEYFSYGGTYDTATGNPLWHPPLVMEQILTFIQSQDIFAWVGALVALLSAVIAVASLIPGDEPENTLQKIVDFLSKFSRK